MTTTVRRAEPRAVVEGDLLPVDEPRMDVTTYVTIWLVLLFGVSAHRVLGPLGAIGTPALVVAAGAAFFWIAMLFTRSLALPAGIQPMRIALLIYLWYAMATVVKAHTRPLTGLEQTGSVREVFTLMALTGVALLVMDGIDSFSRLETLLRRVVGACTYFAGVGLVQFATGISLIFPVPFLSINGSIELVGSRASFNRPQSTALHPIEFAVVTAALFPVAIYFASRPGLSWRQRTGPLVAAGMIALSAPLSISRSGIVTIVGGLGIMWLGWNWRERVWAGAIGLASLPVLWLGIPGLLGTFESMFTSTANDPSIQARLERVPKIIDIIRDQPWFGLGAGTYSVEDYFIVDNEFWVSTMETGIVGIVLLYAVIVLGAVMAISSRHHPFATRNSVRMGYAIAAGLVGLGISTFTFDAFFYHIFRGILFLLLGATGALWRLTRTPRVMDEGSPGRRRGTG